MGVMADGGRSPGTTRSLQAGLTVTTSPRTMTAGALTPTDSATSGRQPRTVVVTRWSGPYPRSTTAAGVPGSARRRFYRALGQSVTAWPVRADSVAASARRSASMASAIEVGGVLPSATASMKAVSSRR